MTDVQISAEARQDLTEIGDYIAFKLCNKVAARRLLTRIQKAVMSLARFPKSGTPLNFITPNCIYRYIICGNYMIFYHISEDSVYVDRILYGRRDYLSILFREEFTEDTD